MGRQETIGRKEVALVAGAAFATPTSTRHIMPAAFRRSNDATTPEAPGAIFMASNTHRGHKLDG
jgi:hypothetical protein